MEGILKMNNTCHIPFSKDIYDPNLVTLPYHFWHHVWDKPFSPHSHNHNGLELGTVRSGRGVLYLGGREYGLRAGDCFFIDAMMPHFQWPQAAAHMELVVVVVKTETAISSAPIKGDLRILRPFTLLRFGVSPVICGNRELADMFEKAFAFSKSGQPEDDLRTWAELFRALARIAQIVLRTSGDASGRPFDASIPEKTWQITKAIALLHERYNEELQMAEIAQACSLSVSRFYKLFVEIMKMPPHEYRTAIRIRHAAGKILQSNEKISSIALECGFSSYSRFLVNFKKLIGLPPEEFKKKGGR
jgi:AraC-like DNA-binding protein/mannose-6-phosphate isomerase-like protein (cupin superfamily)